MGPSGDKEEAEKRYESWMAELHKFGMNDDAARRQILDQVNHINEMVAVWKHQVDETKDRLIHKTNHETVLAAAREVIQTRQEYKHDLKWHGGSPDDGLSFIAPDDPKLPTAIRALNAVSIFGYDTCLRIEFGNGFHHQGFIAYADSVTNSPDARDGFQKMIDGLWFYEDTQ